MLIDNVRLIDLIERVESGGDDQVHRLIGDILWYHGHWQLGYNKTALVQSADQLLELATLGDCLVDVGSNRRTEEDNGN